MSPTFPTHSDVWGVLVEFEVDGGGRDIAQIHHANALVGPSGGWEYTSCSHRQLFLSNVYGVGEKKETYDMVSGEGGTVERDQGGTEEG